MSHPNFNNTYDEHPMKVFNKLCLFIAGSALIWGMVLGGSILTFSSVRKTTKSDVAIVLGAKVWKDSPSPVFKARIDHAIHLYKAGTVSKILFTGGALGKNTFAKSVIAKEYSLRQKIPSNDILTETNSTTTHENLLEAKKLMATHRLRTALIISDPLHMRRAITMAGDMGLKVFSSPIQTSTYQSLATRIPFFFREMYFYNRYLINGM